MNQSAHKCRRRPTSIWKHKDWYMFLLLFRDRTKAVQARFEAAWKPRGSSLGRSSNAVSRNMICTYCRATAMMIAI